MFTPSYFIKCPAAEYATQKPDENLTRVSLPRMRVWPVKLPTWPIVLQMNVFFERKILWVNGRVLLRGFCYMLVFCLASIVYL